MTLPFCGRAAVLVNVGENPPLSRRKLSELIIGERNMASRRPCLPE
jgi:hypothetical protein